MERLANLTPTDIDNGVLNQLLHKAGIPDVQNYVKQFHQQTEDLIIEELEHIDPSDSNTGNNEIASASDIKSWLTGLRPRLEKSIDESVPEPLAQPETPPPTDLSSWAHRIAPSDILMSTEDTTTPESMPVSGDLGTWLNDWSKSLAQQAPPTSIDSWLQGLISKNINEPLGKANNPKGRLNSYLNAAQEVLSQHGYKVDSGAVPTTAQPPVKAGMFGNVKHMYFLVSTALVSLSPSRLVSSLQWRTLDKNNDRKITVEDVQIMLQELGLGFLSKYAAQTLFEMVDTNHDGTLQFRDFVALMGIIKQLVGAMGSAKA